MGAEIVAEGEGGLARAGDDRLRRRPAPATSSSACAESASTAASSPPAAIAGRRLGVVVVRPERTPSALEGAWVFAVADPLAAMQALARAWRRALGARVVGVTGSVGKTSVKDIARALLPGSGARQPREPQHRDRAAADRARGARRAPRLLVLEMAMRGPGQIAELAAIAEPEVAVITNVGPVHVELLGSVEAIAAAKAEVLGRCRADGIAIVAGRRGRAGAAPGRSAPACSASAPAATSRRSRAAWREGVTEALIDDPGGRQRVPLPLHRGAQPDQRPGRGRRRRGARRPARGDGRPRCEHRILPLPGRAPRARRRDRPRERLLQRQPGVDARGARPPRHARRWRRRIAVLGEMAELGPGAAGLPPRGRRPRPSRGGRPAGRGRRAGPRLRARRAGRRPPRRRRSCSRRSSSRGDAVLVKGSRSAGLEAVAETLEELL